MASKLIEPRAIEAPPPAVKNVENTVSSARAAGVPRIDDNWALPRLGGEAMEQWAGSLAGMFDFNMPARTDVLILDPASGMPSGGGDVHAFLAQTINAAPALASAPSTTASQGGTFQNTSSRKATAAIAKSTGVPIALVQTGV